MSMLDVSVIIFVAFIILYSGYQYFKEEAELPKYPHDIGIKRVTSF